MPAPTVTEVVEKRAGLKVRVLEFFQQRKFQAFTAPEVAREFTDAKTDSFNRAIAMLIKHKDLRSTGEMRGGFPCLILNRIR